MTEQAHPDDEALASVSTADEVELLFVQSSSGTRIDGDRLHLSGIGATTLAFSDRPARVAGHVPTAEFVDSWDKGDDNFASDPPNAVLSTFLGDEVNDVVVVLRDPQVADGSLSYQVEVTDGELPVGDGPSSLFIDMIGRPLTPMSIAGVRRRGRRRGRRRARRRGF